MWRKFFVVVLLLAAIAGCVIFQRPAGVVVRGNGDEVVVLLHGLRRTSRAMDTLASSLARDGYTVVNCNYPSHTARISELAEWVRAEIAPRVANAPTAHFVTHSMGGIVLRKMLQEHPLPNIGRVVMLAPPNQGSEVTDQIGGWWVYQWVNGPAGNELGTSTNNTPFQLGPPPYPLGVIAGDRTLNPFFSWLIPGPDDGKVGVARTRAEGMADFIVLHVTHTWMMRDKKVIEQTRHFLKHGAFDKN